MESASPSTDRREALVGRLTESALNTMEICCVYLGDRLGLYRALRSGLPTTAPELAAYPRETVVAEKFPFERAPDAHRFISERRNVGKVVLTP